jgi:hypothetical protein
VLGSVFRLHVYLSLGRVVVGRPVRPGGHRLRPRRVVLLPGLRGGFCRSGVGRQGAEPLPAGEEGFLPGPVGADGEGSLPGVPGQPGWKMPDPVAERVRGGVAEFEVVGVAEEAGPGGEVGGDVRGEDPAGVDLPGLGGRLRRPIAFAVRTPPVSTTACSRWTTSMYWACWLPGTPGMPSSGTFVQVMLYRQPVSFS